MQPPPSPDQWKQIQRIVQEVASLNPAARASRITQVCGEDQQLRALVVSLLEPLTTPPPTSAAASLPGDMTGRVLNQYEVQETLGAGGMGTVYRALDHTLKRTVALKFLAPGLSRTPTARARFMQEARTAATLDHPNIGTIYDISEADGLVFIVMALYEGETLHAKIERGPLSPAIALDYAVQIARGLARAHASGIIHRDIKPANLIVTPPSPAHPAGLLKIVDFGLAKTRDLALTQTGMAPGTVVYMSPEQARGEAVDHRTDIWSFGVVLYEMLTGGRPFGGEYEMAVLYAIMNTDPEPVTTINPGVPEGMAHVVSMCLEKDPGLRYPDLGDVLADLDALASDRPPSAARPAFHPERPPSPPEAVSARPRAVGRLAALGIGLTALVVVLLLFALTPLRGVLPGFGLPEQQSLAVLPFDNVGGDEANRAFIDGLVYTVTSKLTEMEAFQTALSVVPARDMLQAGLIGTRQAAERFNVNLVVAGSVERSATDLRLTLQLIDPRREKVLASRQLQAPLSDLSSLQAGVVHTLAELLALELDPDARATLTAGGTTVPLAFEFYTRALGYLQRFEEEANIDRAINLFELAVQEDPGYALAFAGLGEAYLHKYQAHQDRSWIDAAVRSGEQAVALNDRLAPVQVTLGMIYAETGFPQQAERAYQRALTLDPRSASAHYLLGDVYAHLGQDDRAEASYLRAIDLKPSYWLYHNALGQLYSRLGRHEEAIPPFKQVIALQPDNPWGYNNVGVQYNRMDRLDEAITWYERATRANPDARRATAFAYLNLAGIHYARDQFAEAARMYEQAVMNQPADRLAWIDLGDARFWAGDPEGAATAWREAERLARERLAVNAQDLEARALQAALLARLGETARARALLLDLPPGPDLSPDALLDLAKAWEILGDRPRALHYLQSALERGYAPAVLAFSAWLDDLRTDPAYARLLRQTLPGS